MIEIVTGMLESFEPDVQNMMRRDNHGVRLYLRMDGAGWQFDHPDRQVGKSTDADEKEWAFIDLTSWSEVHQLLNRLTTYPFDQRLRHAIFRAIPRIANGVCIATLVRLDDNGIAIARYAWEFYEWNLDLLGGPTCAVEVDEAGGMRGGTFVNTTPYPVPGIDLEWIDLSPGG